MMEQWIKRIILLRKKNLVVPQSLVFLSRNLSIPSIQYFWEKKGVFQSALYWLMHFSLGVYLCLCVFSKYNTRKRFSPAVFPRIHLADGSFWKFNHDVRRIC